MDDALAWIEGDPDPVTRAELRALVDAGDRAGLADRMRPLRFGTAGIRGAVGAGPGRMNRAVVIRTTRGLADHLRARGDAGLVVVGYDGRTDSRRFAGDTVAVLLGAGMRVARFRDVAPTPLVAHTAKRLGAAAAVVVTASHNPAGDNGYKVYDANSAQIVPPTDRMISAAIDAVGPASEVPMLDPEGSEPVGEEAVEAYVSEVLAFRGKPCGAALPIVYTPLHGVAGDLAVRLLAEAGHEASPVAEQFEPDGTFPTVAFPNPEEPGALDMAEAQASASSASLVLANDPDGDRLAVSIPGPDGWRRLTGNEIGVLLADWVLQRSSGDDRLVINSVVSSPMLAALAGRHGVQHAATLTGFKWICNAALDLEATGSRFVFGYEEALGFTIGPVVRDKDGMSAAVWFADLAAHCQAAGESVEQRLVRLHVADGLWVSHQEAATRSGPDGASEIAGAMARLRDDPPAAVAGVGVAAVTDYSVGAEERPRWLPAADLVELSLEDGSRLMARPSGTEPKLKVYADVCVRIGSASEYPTAYASALERARRSAEEVSASMGLA